MADAWRPEEAEPDAAPSRSTPRSRARCSVRSDVPGGRSKTRPQGLRPKSRPRSCPQRRAGSSAAGAPPETERELTEPHLVMPELPPGMPPPTEVRLPQALPVEPEPVWAGADDRRRGARIRRRHRRDLQRGGHRTARAGGVIARQLDARPRGPGPHHRAEACAAHAQGRRAHGRDPRDGRPEPRNGILPRLARGGCSRIGFRRDRSAAGVARRTAPDARDRDCRASTSCRRANSSSGSGPWPPRPRRARPPSSRSSVRPIETPEPAAVEVVPRSAGRDACVRHRRRGPIAAVAESPSPRQASPSQPVEPPYVELEFEEPAAGDRAPDRRCRHRSAILAAGDVRGGRCSDSVRPAGTRARHAGRAPRAGARQRRAARRTAEQCRRSEHLPRPRRAADDLDRVQPRRARAHRHAPARAAAQARTRDRGADPLQAPERRPRGARTSIRWSSTAIRRSSSCRGRSPSRSATSRASRACSRA